MFELKCVIHARKRFIDINHFQWKNVGLVFIGHRNIFIAKGYVLMMFDYKVNMEFILYVFSIKIMIESLTSHFHSVIFGFPVGFPCAGEMKRKYECVLFANDEWTLCTLLCCCTPDVDHH